MVDSNRSVERKPNQYYNITAVPKDVDPTIAQFCNKAEELMELVTLNYKDAADNPNRPKKISDIQQRIEAAQGDSPEIRDYCYAVIICEDELEIKKHLSPDTLLPMLNLLPETVLINQTNFNNIRKKIIDETIKGLNSGNNIASHRAVAKRLMIILEGFVDPDFDKLRKAFNGVSSDLSHPSEEVEPVTSSSEGDAEDNPPGFGVVSQSGQVAEDQIEEPGYVPTQESLVEIDSPVSDWSSMSVNDLINSLINTTDEDAQAIWDLCDNLELAESKTDTVSISLDDKSITGYERYLIALRTAIYGREITLFSYEEIPQFKFGIKINENIKIPRKTIFQSFSGFATKKLSQFMIVLSCT